MNAVLSTNRVNSILENDPNFLEGQYTETKTFTGPGCIKDRVSGRRAQEYVGSNGHNNEQLLYSRE